jgi:hypothetical protein
MSMYSIDTSALTASYGPETLSNRVHVFLSDIGMPD